jgi:hypothetical protein
LLIFLLRTYKKETGYGCRNNDRTPDALIKAAHHCFINDEYQKVTTRQVEAASANNNIKI